MLAIVLNIKENKSHLVLYSTGVDSGMRYSRNTEELTRQDNKILGIFNTTVGVN